MDVFDPNDLDYEDDDENHAMDTEDHDNHDEQAMTRDVMIAEAKMYRELENLVWALEAMEKWRDVLDQQSGWVAYPYIPCLFLLSRADSGY